MIRCLVTYRLGLSLLSKIINWMSLLIVSPGLSSVLALGKLIQCRRSSRTTRRVCRDLCGGGQSWSSAIQTFCSGYQLRTRAINRQICLEAVAGEKAHRVRPLLTSYRRNKQNNPRIFCWQGSTSFRAEV